MKLYRGLLPALCAASIFGLQSCCLLTDQIQSSGDHDFSTSVDHELNGNKEVKRILNDLPDSDFSHIMEVSGLPKGYVPKIHVAGIVEGCRPWLDASICWEKCEAAGGRVYPDSGSLRDHDAMYIANQYVDILKRRRYTGSVTFTIARNGSDKEIMKVNLKGGSSDAP